MTMDSFATALAVCRFAHFLAAALTFGGSFYLCLLSSASLRETLAPRLRGLVYAASGVAVASLVAWVAVDAASFSNDWGSGIDPDAIGAVVFDTDFGRASLARGAIAATLALVLTLFCDRRWARPTILSALLVASLGLIGHAAMQEGPIGALHRANHATHLLAISVWIGGLPAFAMCATALCGQPPWGAPLAAMTKFSSWGRFVVAIIALTGAANIAMTSGAPPLPQHSLYATLLDWKLLVFAAMTSLALFNRYVLAPRLDRWTAARYWLSGSAWLEFALGVVVIALVAVFAELDPH